MVEKPPVVYVYIDLNFFKHWNTRIIILILGGKIYVKRRRRWTYFAYYITGKQPLTKCCLADPSPGLSIRD